MMRSLHKWKPRDVEPVDGSTQFSPEFDVESDGFAKKLHLVFEFLDGLLGLVFTIFCLPAKTSPWEKDQDSTIEWKTPQMK